MSVFSRLKDNAKAMVNGVLDNMEDPILLYDQSIRDMEESLNKAKTSSATVLGNKATLVTKLDHAKTDAQDWDEKVKRAVTLGKDDLAKKALAKKLEADKNIEKLTAAVASATEQNEKLLNNLNELSEALEKKRAERDTFVARLNTADAAEKVNEILADVQSSTNSIDTDRLERKLEAKEAKAAGLGMIADNNNSLEDEFAALDTVDLDAELAKYKS